MNTWQWASFAFTCGLWLGYWIPKFLDWLDERYAKKISKEYEEYIKRKKSEDTCICCGEIVPEGRQVCPQCESNFTENEVDDDRS